MIEEQYNIEFTYNGKDYSGLVSPGDRTNETFIIQYTLEPSRTFEKTIEICSSENKTGSIALEWQEQMEEVGQTASDPGLIRVIGEAIENHE